MKEKGSISRVEASLPPGFRFHPTDDELVCDYLMNKFTNPAYHQFVMLLQVDLNKCEPWDLPQNACVGGKEWYFYSQRDRKYATGLRTNRATATGYWKATGKDRAIVRKGSLVGMRKTLVFYQGRAPKGKKTDWVMHEFRLQEPSLPPPPFKQQDWVLCRVFHKNKEEGTAKQGGGGGACSHDTTASSSLPPLMDSLIRFDQPENNNIQLPGFLHENTSQRQQVPCFSISSHTQVTEPTLTGLPIAGLTYEVNPGSVSRVPPGLSSDDSFSSDQMVLRTLLSQLTKVESPSLGERSTESLLSEVGMPLTGTSWLH